MENDGSYPDEMPEIWAAQVRTRAATLDTMPEMTAPNRAAPLALVNTQSDDPIPETAEDRVARMLTGATADDRASVRVYRIKDNNSHKLSWCENYSPADFEAGDLAMIRKKWGPGRYQIRLYGHDSAGRFLCRAKEDIEIEDNGERAAAPVAEMQSGMHAMLQMMQEQNARVMETLSQRPDPMAQLTQTIGLITAMKPLFDQGGGKSQIGEIVAAVRELRAVSDEINPKPEPEEQGLTGMLAPILQMIAAGQQAQQAQPLPAQAPALPMPPVSVPPSLRGAPAAPVAPAQADPAPVPIPAPITAIQPATPTDPESMTPDQLIDFTRVKLLELVEMAKRGADPEDGAELVYEVLPDDALPLMLAPNWFDLMSKLVPEVVPYREWMTKARDIAAAWFEEDAAEDAAEEQAPAPSTNPPAA